MSAAPSYIPVPVESLVGEAKTEFDLYLQLSSKYVLYLRKGGVFDSGRLDKMREKNVRNMFITGVDEAAFRAYYDRKVDLAYDPQSPMPTQERAAFVHGAQAAAAEAIMADLKNSGIYKTGEKGAKRFTEFLVKDESSLKSLLAIPNPTKNVSSHGVSVAALAVTLAKKLGHGEAKDLHMLALGCLLHDVGHAHSPGSGFGLSLKTLNAEQLKLYREHTMTGVRAVQELVHFDQHVVKIILEHEEHIDGSGYPKGLKEKQMHAYPVIAATANAFVHLVETEGESFPTAMKRLVVEKIGRHPLTHINALKAIVQTLG